MEELNGRMLACQIMIAALVARVANQSPDPLTFLTDYRDEVRAVLRGINISGEHDVAGIRRASLAAADELFGLMKPPSEEPDT